MIGPREQQGAREYRTYKMIFELQLLSVEEGSMPILKRLAIRDEQFFGQSCSANYQNLRCETCLVGVYRSEKKTQVITGFTIPILTLSGRRDYDYHSPVLPTPSRTL